MLQAAGKRTIDPVAAGPEYLVQKALIFLAIFAIQGLGGKLQLNQRLMSLSALHHRGRAIERDYDD
jgi:hypothetical protein